MVATDVASRGIGMIYAHCPLVSPPLPSDALTFFVVRTVALLSVLARTIACLTFLPVSVGFRPVETCEPRVQRSVELLWNQATIDRFDSAIMLWESGPR